MININCTSDCEYQKDGKCTMASTANFRYFDGKCAYFMPKNKITKFSGNIISHRNVE